jgi:hypothetical protein
VPAQGACGGIDRVCDRACGVITACTNRQTDVDEKYFVTVDVTEEFPFVVSKMSPYLSAEPEDPKGDVRNVNARILRSKLAW